MGGKGSGRRRASPIEREHEIVELFDSGLSVSEIARRYSVSASPIMAILDRNGIAWHIEKHDFDVVLAASLYASGKTLTEVGDVFGVSYQTVRRKLADYGTPIRKTGKRSIFTPKESRDAKHMRDKKRRDAIVERVHDGPKSGLKWRDVAKRDHMRCKICGCKVDPTDKWVNERGRLCFGRSYPTIDHIVALKNGGTDTYDNVQLACKRCNSSKQAKGQLKLFA